MVAAKRGIAVLANHQSLASPSTFAFQENGGITNWGRSSVCPLKLNFPESIVFVRSRERFVALRASEVNFLAAMSAPEVAG